MSQTAETPPANHPKIDIAKALTLRLTKNMTYEQIGATFGVSKQSTYTALKKFLKLIDNPQLIKTYRNHKPELFEAAEMELLTDLMDEDKRKAATLNNTAYALKNVNEMLRLERGQSTANVAYDPGASMARIAELRLLLESTQAQSGYDNGKAITVKPEP